MNTPIFEVTLEGEEDGVEAVSVVDFPAIEKNFVTLSKEVKLAEFDNEKRIMYGAALIPNKLIYRETNEGEPFYIYFSKDTIEKTAHKFIKNNQHHNHTVMHEKPIEGLSVVESWITPEPIKQFGVPAGTWMLKVKVDNEKFWKEEIKSGKLKGFSIEGWYGKKIAASLQKDIIFDELQKVISENLD